MNFHPLIAPRNLPRRFHAAQHPIRDRGPGAKSPGPLPSELNSGNPNNAWNVSNFHRSTRFGDLTIV
ncbi:hypothetical protein IMZ48_04215 [Candidatus Bathyarchaeota archaeon]|nr:hypothetical protein [Candidatus Bathyarchaeota archaeon]